MAAVIGLPPMGKTSGLANDPLPTPPLPSPKSTPTEPELANTRSAMPSRSMSPAATFHKLLGEPTGRFVAGANVPSP